jgi:putative hydrolase of the HAD superfamily
MDYFKGKAIKNIIFDLGNVLLETNINLTVTEFRKLGISDMSKMLINEKNIKFYCDFEKGLINVKDFRDKIRVESNLKFSDEQFDYAWNKMLLTITEDKTEIIKNIKSKFKIFLLSNTNQIHFDFFEKQEFWIDNLYDMKFYSHQLGMRKPDREIFKYILTRTNILAEETFFIDDNIDNIQSAKKINFNTILFKDITLNEIFYEFI